MTVCRFVGSIAILMSVSAGFADELTPELSVKEIMNSIVTPATNTIWGAYQLETDIKMANEPANRQAVMTPSSAY